MITGFGSVWINGVRYDTRGAVFTTDDNAGASVRDLRHGMVVQVKGQYQGSQQAVAETIDYVETLQGPFDKTDRTSCTTF